MKKLISCFTLILCTNIYALETDFFGDILLRYETEQGHEHIPERERIRAIAHAGLKVSLSQMWSANVRLSTGLKNKQNVPAITVHRFNTQASTDNDIFIERAYVQGQFERAQLFIGKIPWKTKQLSDVFWDRNLNPIGLHVDYQVADNHQLQVASFRPLDGQSATVGHMTVLQWNMNIDLGAVTWRISPWVVDYRGEKNATYARKDTELDKRFFRLSSSLKFQSYQLGFDFGHSLVSFDNALVGEFRDQKDSLVVEFRYGDLKHVGHSLLQLRYLHVERFSVLSEFAQNATSRFATSNYQGIDLRIRRKMGKNWWFGARYSDMQTIKGELEQGIRFRIEGQYRF